MNIHRQLRTKINQNDKFGGKQPEISRQGTTLSGDQAEIVEQEGLPDEKEKNEVSASYQADSEKFIAKEIVSSPPIAYKVRPQLPFPQRLKNHNNEIQFKKFVDVLDQLYINVPLLKAIEQMPSCAKFLKDIVMKKRIIERIENVIAAKELCFTLSKLLSKQKDLGSFVIPCFIGDNFVGRALVDLG
ncbi:uncharacterized protein LOC120143946 [Hibiscus syriacus]|uniref:uncharacterized protein LOC120143946 n=1 Tax=Hibiscus syriacus TaxID=106335 RepID=UPI0019240818|nr:uncharacterized protein LOC120143946 [Hibiscus syriacus]